MCVLFIYLNPDATGNQIKLIVVNIRDEFWHRPTAPAAFWEDSPNIIGGRDMFEGREGGSWLVASKEGKIASLLNILEPSNAIKADKKGRGFLAVDFLRSNQSIEEYLGALNKEKSAYNGFNVVTIDLGASKQAARLGYLCNRSPNGFVVLDSGVHVLGNSVPPKRWGKICAGEEKFRQICSSFCLGDGDGNSGMDAKERDALIERLFEMVDDTTQYPVDGCLREQTDETDETLRPRNALKFYIPAWNYGSRTHSVIVVSGDGGAIYTERTVEVEGSTNGAVTPDKVPTSHWTTRRFEFDMNINN